MKATTKNYAVIAAGGKGTRFWPLSRIDRPKQLLRILTHRSLIGETARRIGPLFAWENILVVTGAGYFKEIAGELPGLPAKNILLEPQGNNTAPCIGLAAIEIAARDPNACMVIFPADHWIGNRNAFRKTVQGALKLAGETDSLVTVGIRPTYPETGYGYIHKAKPVSGRRGLSAFHVRAFHEKPDRATAARLIRSGSLWNSGIFAWKVSSILGFLRSFSPGIFRGLMEIKKARATSLGGIPGPRLRSVLRKAYQKMPAISIDHAVLEKAAAIGKVFTVDAAFDWSDLGSWESLHRILPRDAAGNAAIGKSLAVDAKGCLVFSPYRLVVLLGTRNTVVVDSPDALLIAERGRSQDVREVVNQLEAKGYGRYLKGRR